MPSLAPFSTAIVDERFRAKIGFDTNLLMYLLDNTYPKLNDFVAEFSNFKPFVDLITNKYALFELYEKRKESHFIRIANSLGYDENILNSDRFHVHGKVKYDKFLRFITATSLLGDKLYLRARAYCIKKWRSHIKLGNTLFFENYSTIGNSVRTDIPKIQNDFGIDTVGTLHDNLWSPTFELIFHSRISREDSLIAMAFIKPDMIRNENNVTVLTNDGDFQTFFTEATSQGLITPLFAGLNIPVPNIERISRIKGDFEIATLHNLRGNTPLLIGFSDLVKGFLKRLIIQNNEKYFIGLTDGSIAPQSPNAIGIRVIGKGEYHANQNLLFVGSDLDFVYSLPYTVGEFRDHTATPITFPLRYDPAKSPEHNRVVFMHTTLDVDDPDKQYEHLLIPALKRGNNLVFVHPDS